MRPIAVEQDDSYREFGGLMWGMTYRNTGNRDLGGHADITEWARSKYWGPILAQLGLSWDDIKNRNAVGGGCFLSGSATAIQTFQSLVTQYTNGLYSASINSKGQLEIARTDKKGYLIDSKQIAFLNILKDLTDPSKPAVTIELLENSTNVLFGQAFGGEIDISDVAAVGDLGFVSSGGILAHELHEQILAQRDGLKDENAQSYHDRAILEAEDPVNGSIRGAMDTRDLYSIIIGKYRASNYEIIERLIRNGNLNIFYSQNGIQHTLSLIINNNNVTGVIDPNKAY